METTVQYNPAPWWKLLFVTDWIVFLRKRGSVLTHFPINLLLPDSFRFRFQNVPKFQMTPVIPLVPMTQMTQMTKVTKVTQMTQMTKVMPILQNHLNHWEMIFKWIPGIWDLWANRVKKKTLGSKWHHVTISRVNWNHVCITRNCIGIVWVAPQLSSLHQNSISSR